MNPSQLELFATKMAPGAAQPGAAQPGAAQPGAAQPHVPVVRPAADLARRLTSLLGKPVSVVLTNNRTRIFSARPGDDVFAIRLHRCFAGAPEPVLRAIVVLARRRPSAPVPRKALATIRAHHARETPAPGESARVMVVRPVGKTLDLRVLRDEINQACFDGALDVAITWGAPLRRGRAGRVPRSIRLGSYDPRTGMVRIHRALDAPDVPRYVVAAIVHHEMLHAAMPPEGCNAGGRRVVHSAAFRARERAYEHHARSEAWLQAYLPRLLRRARSVLRIDGACCE